MLTWQGCLAEAWAAACPELGLQGDPLLLAAPAGAGEAAGRAGSHAAVLAAAVLAQPVVPPVITNPKTMFAKVSMKARHIACNLQHSTSSEVATNMQHTSDMHLSSACLQPSH